MSFDPEKFYINLLDFFSILIPGAVAVYVARPYLSELLHVSALAILGSPESWMVFLFISYLSGHFVFIVGATLDDWLYQPLRESTKTDKGLSSGGNALPARYRGLVKYLFKQNPDRALQAAERLKKEALPRAMGDAINTYQWCKARLSKDHPAGLDVVQRFEAASKFFRSLSVILYFLCLGCSIQGNGMGATFCFVLLLLALWRYIDQRFKATQQAYWFAISLDTSHTASTPSVSPPHPPDPSDDLVCIIFRGGKNGVRYRLHRTRPDQ